MTEQEIFRTFASMWAASSDTAAEPALRELEAQLALELPGPYRRFVIKNGTPYCPALLDAIVQGEADLHDVQQFLPLAELHRATAQYEAAGMDPGFIGFASDSMGNMFLFRAVDCEPNQDDAPVWFFDHDFVSVEQIAPSFLDWLAAFVAIDPSSAQLTQ